MHIRMKVGISGTFHNLDGGVQPGQVVEVDDDNGARYVRLGYADKVGAPKAEAETRAAPEPEQAEEPVEEHAVAEPEGVETADAPRPRTGRPKPPGR